MDTTIFASILTIFGGVMIAIIPAIVQVIARNFRKENIENQKNKENVAIKIKYVFSSLTVLRVSPPKTL